MWPICPAKRIITTSLWIVGTVPPPAYTRLIEVFEFLFVAGNRYAEIQMALAG
jgi:hypothetical protein